MRANVPDQSLSCVVGGVVRTMGAAPGGQLGVVTAWPPLAPTTVWPGRGAERLALSFP